MATIFSLYPYNPMLYVLTPSSPTSASSFWSFGKRSKLAVLAAHSNPRIVKTNRKSRRSLLSQLTLMLTRDLSHGQLKKKIDNRKRSGVGGLLTMDKALECPKVRKWHPYDKMIVESVENSLKPTVRYLVEEVGIKEKDLGKVIQLSPQILVQRIDISWNTRYMFLTKELGAPKDSVVKMVTKHPQLLHYSIDDGLLPRINFLRSIGMKNSDILKVLTSLTQVLSLSLEENLKPKYLYLVNELNNEVQSLTKYPMYLSLSLDQRIRPRHRFLVSLKKAPKGPFPLGSLVPTDECFCQQWAGTSLDKYLAFRQKLLLKKFAEKYERKM
ncbi:Transcription termination factor, mitochondrial/chloroplastic [Sesbania bispinosa]|nr:Transcription termination factor, mitochondrial/chloroplastic [Sesbania bispinosa]